MEWTKQFGRYIVVMLLQVLLFNQLQLWGICHPYIDILAGIADGRAEEDAVLA